MGRLCISVFFKSIRVYLRLSADKKLKQSINKRCDGGALGCNY